MVVVYPVNLRLEGRRCAVVGGGHVALRRVRSLARAGAAVTVMAPDVLPELEVMASAGKIAWVVGPLAADMLAGFFVVVCATDSPAVNREAAQAAKQSGALVNMAAPPMELSDFSVPASVARGDLLLTVSTGGGSPELARLLRRELEHGFAATYGAWLERLAPLRRDLAQQADSAAREKFWRSALDERLLTLVKQGRIDEAEAEVKNAIDRFRVKS